jgi:hypothetical protein
MPLIPERLAARSEVRSAVDAQFWEQAIGSARSLDGTARTVPADPPPLGQLTPQGASRPQQLLIIQAGVGPVTPGYDSSNGGAVSFLCPSFFFLGMHFVSRRRKKKNRRVLTPRSPFFSMRAAEAAAAAARGPARLPHTRTHAHA